MITMLVVTMMIFFASVTMITSVLVTFLVMIAALVLMITFVLDLFFRVFFSARFSWSRCYWLETFQFDLVQKSLWVDLELMDLRTLRTRLHLNHPEVHNHPSFWPLGDHHLLQTYFDLLPFQFPCPRMTIFWPHFPSYLLRC